MALDRAETIRNAEKLLRQGKLEAAITEYLRLVEDSPGDWNAANTLGDLYVRAGQIDKAIEQFIQIADSLNDEGALPKASAVYKKILKLKPEHEHTLLQVADILGGQRLYADARAHLNTLIELRRARGDTRGALQAKVRLGSLDPEDYDGRMAAASARIEMGDVAGAHRDLKEIASELADKGRHADAIEVLREAAKLNPDDEEIREKLLDVYFAAGDFVRARECATSVEQFRLLAAALEGQDRTDEALDTLRQASSQNPYDTDLKAELARTFVARGDIVTAAEYLTLETAGDDPELLLTVADIQLRGELFEDGMAIVRRLLEQDVSRRDKIAELGWRVAEQNSEAGFRVVELAADTAVAQGDWPAAAAALQEFVTRVPNHISALMRLVEICVDGGLEATMFAAQAQLADAYIEAGAAVEARFIAEDLVAREPWEKANIERFRRALVLLGEPDPDARIAERLSGETPFTTTDLTLGDALFDEPEPDPEEVAAAERAAEQAEADLLAEAAMADEPPSRRPKPVPLPRRKEDSHHFQLSANAIDLDSILGEMDAPEPPSSATAHAESEDVEVDLSIAFDAVQPGPAPAAPAPAEKPADLNDVFGNLREQASKRAGGGRGRKGLPARARAPRSRRLRWRGAGPAGSLTIAAAAVCDRRAGRTDPAGAGHDERGARVAGARGAGAGANRGRGACAALYDLAGILEQQGESARALAISLELQADAGAYKDVAERIDRLTRVAQG